MKLNGSSYKNIVFHSPLHKVLNEVAWGYFYSEHLCPTLPFLILILALISPSPSLELQGLTFTPKTSPRKEKPIVLIISTEKNMRKPFVFSVLTPKHLLSPAFAFTFYLRPSVHGSFALIPYTNTHCWEITFFFTTTYFL